MHRRTFALAITVVVIAGLGLGAGTFGSAAATAQGDTSPQQITLSGESENGYPTAIPGNVSGTVDWDGFDDGVETITVEVKAYGEADREDSITSETFQVDSADASGSYSFEEVSFPMIENLYTNMEELVPADGETKTTDLDFAVVMTVEGPNGETADVVNQHRASVEISNLESENGTAATAEASTEMTGTVIMSDGEE